MVQGTVLIVEDDRQTRDGLQFAFIRRNWEVVVTETEAGGLALLGDCKPDWVIVSWDQLAGTGSRFVREVRARVRGVRVSLVTDSGSHAARILQGFRPDLVFSKPICPDEVFSACEALASGEPAVIGRAV